MIASALFDSSFRVRPSLIITLYLHIRRLFSRTLQDSISCLSLNLTSYNVAAIISLDQQLFTYDWWCYFSLRGIWKSCQFQNYSNLKRSIQAKQLFLWRESHSITLILVSSDLYFVLCSYFFLYISRTKFKLNHHFRHWRTATLGQWWCGWCSYCSDGGWSTWRRSRTCRRSWTICWGKCCSWIFEYRIIVRVIDAHLCRPYIHHTYPQ